MSLDDALAAWAGTVRLDDETAAAIYQRIVATPAAPAAPAPAAPVVGVTGLDPRWWRDFTVDFAARMVSSTRATARAA
ncbi:MAG: hypothetical protein V7637_1272 [Mycobacteriales bacterium]|jgi:hypothetical protein